jgi:carbonic anhydrase/acetyltransferase-like protein (isoleucine patch superfamily)
VYSLPDGVLQLAMLLVGASVAKDTYLTSEVTLRAFKCADLCSIGRGVFVGGSSDFLFELGTTWHRFTLADGSYIGTNCLLDVGCSLEAGAGIGAYSYLAPNTEVPVGTLFVGNPAHHMTSLAQEGDTAARRFLQLRSWPGWFCHNMFCKTVFKFFMIQPMLSVPIFYFWGMELFREHANTDGGKPSEVLAQVLLGAAAFFAGLFLLILFAQATLLLRCKARRSGVEELRFGFLLFSGYCWMFEQYTTQVFLARWLYALRGTFWMRMILRALGATIGQNVFLDEGRFYEPWFSTVEDNVTMHTGCKPCPHSLEMNGDVLIRRVRICRGCTMLDATTVHGGGVLPENALLGSWSRPFTGQQLEPGREYNGSPCCAVRTETARPMEELGV